MAHPFAQLPTLREFIEEIPISFQLVGPKGKVDIRCLRSPSGRTAVLPEIEEDDRLTPTVLASLCRRLKIDLGLPSL